ncbi:hypothetical protein OROMI_028868 [Orobanche minor]
MSARVELPTREGNSVPLFTPLQTHRILHVTSPLEEADVQASLESDASGLRYAIEGKEQEFHYRYWIDGGGRIYVMEWLPDYMVSKKWQPGDTVYVLSSGTSGKGGNITGKLVLASIFSQGMAFHQNPARKVKTTEEERPQLHFDNGFAISHGSLFKKGLYFFSRLPCSFLLYSMKFLTQYVIHHTRGKEVAFWWRACIDVKIEPRLSTVASEDFLFAASSNTWFLVFCTSPATFLDFSLQRGARHGDFNMTLICLHIELQKGRLSYNLQGWTRRGLHHCVVL